MTLRPGEKHQVKYTFVNELRCVEPYIFVFRCGAKGRWFKREILQVFLDEFGMYPPDYYKESIRCGTITVNGQKVDPTYLLRNGDKVVHKTHRHEPPVTGKEVEVIAETEELVVVDKPATIPIHPCGAYRYNTLTTILSFTRPDVRLHLIYRLDRLVSGLTILAKTPYVANRISKELQAGQTQKVYLARVGGDFGKVDLFPKLSGGSSVEGSGGEVVPPRSEILFDAWVEEKKQGKRMHTNLGKLVDGDVGGGGRRKRGKGRAEEGEGDDEDDEEGEEEDEDVPMEWRVQADGSILVRTGIRCVSFKEGVYECSSRGKASITIFRLKSFDGETSVVECRPVTGRTHQIRLHLKWLNHPIVNDPSYGGDAVVEAYNQKYRCAEKEAHKGYRYSEEQLKAKESAESAAGAPTTAGGKAPVEAAVRQEEEEESEEDRIRRVCPHCAAGGLSHFREQQLRHDGIWLHALRYKGKTWSYETTLPAWAQGHGSGSGGDGTVAAAPPSPPSPGAKTDT